MRKLSTLSLARRFFQEKMDTGKLSVTNVELHQYIAERLQQTRAVLNGTLDGTGHGTLIESKWYTASWHKEKADSGRVTHCRNTSTVTDATSREMRFNTPAKRLVCEKIMNFLPSTGNPLLLTLASEYGNCVRAALRRNPHVRVTNVECNREVLDKWLTQKKELEAEFDAKIIDYNCMLQDFIRAPGFTDQHYALINADVMGYVSEPMRDYLRIIVHARNADFVAITTQCLKGFRNHGPFVNDLRKKYAGSVDGHAECIMDWMVPNYELVDRITYHRDAHSREMEVFIFQLVPRDVLLTE